MRNIVIDSGPLIALFDRDDKFHPQAVSFMQNLTGHLHTNLAVITEVTHMLDFSLEVQRDFLFWSEKSLRIDENTLKDWSRILALLEKYADLPTDFADAALIALCERLNTRYVASVDSDFTIYRDHTRNHFINVFQS